MYLINVVIGDYLNKYGSNIENFHSTIIPVIGQEIFTKKFGRNVVKNVLVDYRQVQCKNEDDKGSEWIFVII